MNTLSFRSGMAERERKVDKVVQLSLYKFVEQMLRPFEPYRKCCKTSKAHRKGFEVSLN